MLKVGDPETFISDVLCMYDACLPHTVTSCQLLFLA